MGSATNQNWFTSGEGGTQPDFAGYQGQPLWTNPYQPRSQMDWARAEYKHFPSTFEHGVHPDYDPTVDYQTLYEALPNQLSPYGGGQEYAKNRYWPARKSEARLEYMLGENAPYWADEWLAGQPGLEPTLRQWQQDFAYYRKHPDEWNQLEQQWRYPYAGGSYWTPDISVYPFQHTV